MPAAHPAPLLGAVLARLPLAAGIAVVREGDTVIVAAQPSAVHRADGTGAFAALDDIDARGGWWAGWLGYDLGHAVERVVVRSPDDVGVPHLCFARFDARLELAPRRPPVVVGHGPAARLLARALAGAVGRRPVPARRLEAPMLRSWTSSLDRRAWTERVRAVLDLVHAGDCYQVNLTRRLRAEQPVDPVALFVALHERHPAPHASLVVPPAAAGRAGVAVVSASPERFLARDGERVETRPIKGTGTDPDRLRASAKDRAENVMIVDLARNDLGRVCGFGSIEVPALCALERHPGLHHLVSTVRGRLRPGVGTAELLAATLPPASVTGAPKPRVMQVIEDLEPVRRGVYCGAVGWIDADRSRADLAVAIRTFTCSADATYLGVGSGIVADSDPDAEWHETEVKAGRLLRVAALGHRVPARAGAA